MHGGTHLGFGINLETSHTGVECRHLGDVVVLALALLLLELEGNTTDGATLDTLHQVGREASDLVAKTLRWDDGLSEWQHDVSTVRRCSGSRHVQLHR